MKIDTSELSKVTYLDVKSIGDRRVFLMPFWDGESWRLWFPIEGKLVVANAVDAAHTDYIAKLPVKESDLFIPFVDTMWQKLCWPQTHPIIQTICDDFHCLAASVAKLRHIHRSQKQLDSLVCSLFAATEVQYICIVARGIFDLLQETIAELWSRTDLLDPELQKKKKSRSLPQTFSKMVLKDKSKPKTATEISEEYFLPDRLAEEYARQAEFFQLLRDFRDSFVHGHGPSPLIFTTERGFCVSSDSRPFKWTKGWTQDQRYNENLVSLLPWLNQIIAETINSCNALITAFGRQIQFPPDMAPGYRIFVRGVCNDALLEIQRNVSWWD